MIEYLGRCDMCGSEAIEDRGESGQWWVYCYNCDFDHADDTKVDICKDL